MCAPTPPRSPSPVPKPAFSPLPSPLMSPAKLPTRPRAPSRALLALAAMLLPVALVPGVLRLTTAHSGTALSEARMRQIVDKNQDLIYLPAADMLVMTVAKAGSTSTWHWLYKGITGQVEYNRSECATYVQDMLSHCWRGYAMYLYEADPTMQRRILFGGKSLRVAVQRDPFERLISSYKSKFTCEDEVFGTDLRNRATMVPELLRQAGTPDPDRKCLSLEEFAEALERTRVRTESKQGQQRRLNHMNVHVRPAEYYLDEIEWDMVLDVHDLFNLTLLQPVVRRMPFAELVANGPGRRHSSGRKELMISERTARLLHRFAMETRIAETRYLFER